mgnify:CR=1 FL=1
MAQWVKDPELLQLWPELDPWRPATPWLAAAGLIGANGVVLGKLAAEYALELMCQRLNTRVAFGKPLSTQGVWRERIAESRCMIEQARLLTLKAAYMMDTVGNKVAQAEIAMIKIVAPNMACQIIDWAMQAHGGAGISGDFPLAYMYAHQRTLRLADGPDEVHKMTIARREYRRRSPQWGKDQG